MFDDAGQFGFAAQVLVQVVEFVLINGRYPVYAATLWNFKKIDRFYRAKLAVRPPPVERGDFLQRLRPRPLMPIIKDARRQISAAGIRIVSFTGRDESLNNASQLRRNFRFFKRGKPMGPARVLSRFGIRRSAEAH